MSVTIFYICISAFSWNLLTQQGELFDFVPKAVQSVTLSLKINKMLYACAKCVSGQMAFWYSILYFENIKTMYLNIACSVFFTYFIEKKLLS